MAWLGSAPRAENFKNEEHISRAAAFEKYGVTPAMPDAPECGAHLLRFLYEAGPAINTGNGLAQLPPSEIESWARMTRTRLAPWEVRAIREMSAAYASQVTKSDALDCPPPFGGDELDDAAKQVFKAIRFRSSVRKSAPDPAKGKHR